MGESKEELTGLLIKVKEESEKAGLTLNRASLVAQRLKRLPLMRETWVRSLGQEDPLEKEMATHSSTLAWRIPWTEEPGGLQSTGTQKSRTRLSNLTNLTFLRRITKYGHFCHDADTHPSSHVNTSVFRLICLD